MRRTPSLGNGEKWVQVFIGGIKCFGSFVFEVELLSAPFILYKGIAEVKGHLQGEQHLKKG